MFNYPKSNTDSEPASVPAPAPFSPFVEPETSFAPQEATPAVQSAASMAGSRNVLNSDVSVKGILRFSEALLVDGVVEGKITSDGALTVGTNATITAAADDKTAIATNSVLIEGKVTGNVEVTDFVELASTAELVGDITAKRLIIKDGAVFIGLSAVGVASNAPVAKPVSKPVSKPAGKAKAAASTDSNLDLLS